MSQRKILLIGKTGQLGWELQLCLPTLGQVVALDYPEIDLAHPETLRELIQTIAPQLIINAAAYTNVDKAESEADLAWQINAVAPGIMAEEAKKLRAPFIHYSTDFVFDGTKGSPYVEGDTPHPLDEYGRTKLGGEASTRSASESYLILRTAWVYSLRQGGFVNKVLQWSRQQKTLKVVDDQISNPTWCRTLAEASAQVIAQAQEDWYGFFKARAGLYHLAGGGYASRYEWAKTVLELDPGRSEQTVEAVLPAKTSDFPSPAERPLFSALDCTLFAQTFGIELLDWKRSMALLFDVPYK
ncbi:MAG: dTDP-4-dehydrorhamnose reductase [Anaerolineaceae bacterium]|nr:dTDP-4-dehydrorhamnose reductase [Anaerolineaceae bacterium]